VTIQNKERKIPFKFMKLTENLKVSIQANLKIEKDRAVEEETSFMTDTTETDAPSSKSGDLSVIVEEFEEFEEN